MSEIHEIINAIVEEYRLAITGSILCSEETKEEALGKFRKMRFNIAYPKEWKDYGDLEVDLEDLVGNVERIAQFDHQYLVVKLDRSVDPGEWLASPAMVNALYQPSGNKFILLASILQPPFFDA